jgi:hypothetical protein
MRIVAVSLPLVVFSLQAVVVWAKANDDYFAASCFFFAAGLGLAAGLAAGLTGV